LPFLLDFAHRLRDRIILDGHRVLSSRRPCGTYPLLDSFSEVSQQIAPPTLVLRPAPASRHRRGADASHGLPTSLGRANPLRRGDRALPRPRGTAYSRSFRLGSPAAVRNTCSW